MSGQLVNFKVEPNGLRIELLEEGREEVEELYDRWKRNPNSEGGTWIAMAHEVIEHQLCNGWTWLKPKDVGALMDDWTPLLSENVGTDEDGEVTSVGIVYYDPMFAVRDYVEDLLQEGFVIFGKAE